MVVSVQEWKETFKGNSNFFEDIMFHKHWRKLEEVYKTFDEIPLGTILIHNGYRRARFWYNGIENLYKDKMFFSSDNLYILRVKPI